MIFPERTTPSGTLFRGNGPAPMATTAFVTTTRPARRAVVMAASERVDFDMSVPRRDIPDLTARVERAGTPDILHPDQGSQCISFACTDRLRRIRSQTSMDGKGRYNRDVFTEHLWRALECDCVCLRA